MKLEDIVTNNVRGDELSPRLVYAMVWLENWQTTCTIGVLGEIRVRKTRCYDDYTGLNWDWLDSTIL